MTSDAALLIAPALGCKTQPPVYATEGSAGFDLEASIDETIILEPGERVLIPVGYIFAIAKGFWGRISPRSGLAAKHGIDVLAGVIDSDYRGEVKVALINHGREPVTINPRDRVAQMVIAPVSQPKIIVVSEAELGDTERGAGGFGSTGVAAA